MKRIVNFEIDNCLDCVWHSPAFDTNCRHPENGLSGSWREIEGEDHKARFPSWCPLPIAEEEEVNHEDYNEYLDSLLC
jgi:hypothetical protein